MNLYVLFYTALKIKFPEIVLVWFKVRYLYTDNLLPSITNNVFPVDFRIRVTFSKSSFVLHILLVLLFYTYTFILLSLCFLLVITICYCFAHGNTYTYYTRTNTYKVTRIFLEWALVLRRPFFRIDFSELGIRDTFKILSSFRLLFILTSSAQPFKGYSLWIS